MSPLMCGELEKMMIFVLNKGTLFFRRKGVQFNFFISSFSTISNKNINFHAPLHPSTSQEKENIKELEKELEEIHPHWRAMESRVINRKLSSTGKSGRSEVRKSDEDYWLEAGVYDNNKKK